MMSLRALGNLGTQGEAAKAASHYYGNGADYYLKDAQNPESEGQWIGTGCSKLGLTGGPSRDELQLALAGVVAGQEVKNAGRENRQMGWDLTFSAPKSVSIAWASANPELRQKIEEAHNKAVLEAHNYVESETTTRRGHAGCERERAYLVSTVFTHHTSRAGDPQLHSHVVVPNFCVRSDGTVGTVESKNFYDLKMTAGSLYQADLAWRMRSLGYEIENGSSGTFRLARVEPTLEEVFSKRDRQIDQITKDLGINTYAGTRGIVISTRMQKKETDLVERKSTWEREAKAIGLSFDVEHSAIPLPSIVDKDAIKEVSLKQVTEQTSTFQDKDFIRTLARNSYGLLNAQDILSLDSEAKRSRDLRELSQDRFGKWIYSTKEMILLEQKMITTVRKLAQCEGYQVNPTNALEKYSFLNEEQRLAVKSASGDSAIVVIQGRAGVGKTTTLNAIRESFEEKGWKVQGITVAGRAAETLQKETNIEARTFASWSLNSNIDSKTVLIVDETGMLGSRGMKEILEKAHDAGSKVILVGDEKQLQPIDAGGALHAVDQELLKVKPQASSQIATIMRQKHEWMREAVSHAAAGRTEEALNMLKDHDKIRFFDDGNRTKSALIDDYLAREANPHDTIILTHHRSEARDINLNIRSKLQENEIVGKDLIQISNGKQNLSLAVGDCVMFTQNDYQQGVRNGQRGIVEDVNHHTLTVKMEDGVSKEVHLSNYTHLDYGWAMTTHKAQGATVERAYLYGHSSEWMASQQATYVQISRAKEETLLFVACGEKSVERPLQERVLTSEEIKQAFDEISQTWGRDAAKGTTRDHITNTHEMTQGY